WPEGTASTGQRDSVLNGEVMHQPRIDGNQPRTDGMSTTLPLMRSSSGPSSRKSALTAGSARVGQMKTSCLSMIGPKVAYIFAAPSIERRKSSASDFLACLAKLTA